MSAQVRRSALFAVVLLAAALVPSAASAQDVLDTLADSSITLFGNRGFSLKQFRVGVLGNSQSTEYTLRVPAGKRGVVVAVCDNNCSDIDLQVSGDGRALGEDMAADDVPVVNVENFAGQITVRIIMAACGASSCGYRLMLYLN